MKYKKKGYKIASGILAGLLLLVSVLFCVLAIKLGMIPDKLLTLVIVVVVILNLLIDLFLVIFKKGFWFFGILSVLIIILLSVGNYYLYHTQSMLSKITDIAIQTDAVSAYVLADSELQDIQETEGLTFGILEEIDRDNTNKTLGELEQKTGFPITFQEYEDMLGMVDGLYESKVEVIILNDSFVDVINEIPGYETFKEDIRALTTTIQETKIEIDTVEEQEGVNGFFIVYLSGIDTYGGVRNKSRSDVNILAAVNVESKQVLLLSTPRDYYIELPISNGKRDKLTHAGIYGVDISMGTLEMLYDTDIKYFLRINFSGFMKIIDAVGGINVYSQYDFSRGGYSFQKGYNYLNGEEALVFARERKSFSSGDNQRGKNQMEVIKAIIDKCMSPAILSGYIDLLGSVAGSFETNMTDEEIASLVKSQLFEGGEWNVVSYSVTGFNDHGYTYSMPKTNTYIMQPNYDSVETAKNLIQQVKDGEVINLP